MSKFFITIASLLLSASVLHAGGNTSSINLKYPVVLVHGAFMNDINVLGIDYWYGIEKALENKGVKVFVTNQDCFNSTESRAKEVFAYLLSLKAANPALTKFNIIAHSQGALDARYMVSLLSGTLNGKPIKGSDLVVSITSVSGVHRGSPVADLVLGILPVGPARDMVSGVVNGFYRLFFKNETPNSVAALIGLSTPFMNNTFNPNVPDVSSIYYQSYAGKIRSITADFLISAPLNLYITAVDGPNDCLVSVNSAKWGNFRGTIEGAWWCGGVSHFNEIGHLFGVTPGFNAPDFYVQVAKDLKTRGY